jgi:probable phosphoglycerate mutase
MTTLYLVRHGETVDNALQLMQGQVQGELNDTGRQQIAELAEKLKDIHFDAFVSSDLKRAYDSACIIAARRRMEVRTTQLLRERDWGEFTGRYIPDLKGAPWSDDIESLEALLERARQFLLFVTAHYDGQTVVAVGHGIINKAIQAVHYGKQMRQVERMVNCEVRILELK